MGGVRSDHFPTTTQYLTQADQATGVGRQFFSLRDLVTTRGETCPFKDRDEYVLQFYHGKQWVIKLCNYAYISL